MKKILFLLLAAIMSLSQLLAQTVPITIGTGTSTSNIGPIPGYFGNHRSLQLFTAAELNQPSGCVIDSIALELGSVTAGVGGRDVRIYMKEVTETTLASTYVLNTLTDGAVLVYSTETEEICTADTWHTFALQTPFVYSGSSSLMLIFEGEGCTANGGCAVYIKYGPTTSMAWTKCWDTTTPDMTSPIAPSNTYRANTRFYVSEMPEDFCNTVTELAVSNILTDGADVSWTSDAVSFEYEYKLSTESWDSENVVSGTTTSTSVSLSELTPATTYNFRVKAICSDGLESYWMQLSFQTICDVYQVPFEEGFEGGFDFTFADGFIASPLCWANINPAADSYKWQTSTTNHSGSKSAYYYGSTYSATTSQDWLITPQVNLSGNERMNFYVKKVGASNPIGINIYAYDASSEDISSAADVASFVLIDSVPSAALTTTDWYEYELHLSDLGGTYRFALVPYAGAGGLYVDDFSITELPECIRPVMSSVASSEITANEATISWSDENNSQWIVYYKPISATEWASETASSTEVTLTDLIPGTLYNAYVVAVCGDEESDPTYTTSFITLCDVISDFPWTEGFESTWNSQNLMSNTIAAPFCWYNINAGGSTYSWQQTSSTVYEGSKAAYMYCYSSSSSTSSTYKNDDWFITPVFELTGSEVLSFYTKKSSTSSTPELRIYAFSLENGD
ncbi:MAG: choice-of-anchor J domain-containing protein, partial [Bacteroidales bacterium]|nr:choice-of-anchor J domain-containing protein [Bacteroidales bacterium]MDY5789019.1 choice-of-anchor J domain-containing protein [Candidatus Onthomorpha sp.]